MKLDCIAVDDEPVSLNLLCAYIEQTPFLNLVGRFSNGIDALKALHTNKIKIIFLDIRMADLSGIELAKIIEASVNKENTRIIFTTAYDQYAIESYKLEALDYLLKPFNYVDFSRAAAKAQKYFEVFTNHKSNRENSEPIPVHEKKYLYLKVEYQLVKLDLSDILYVEGLKDYVKVFLTNEPKPILSLTSLKSLEEKLAPTHFMRVHRSFIVALDKIKSANKNSIQIGKTTIQVTEQYKDAFLKFLDKWI